MVVVDGLTVTDLPVTAPIGSMLTTGAGKPVTVQLSVVDCPAARLDDAALKLVMAGLALGADAGNAAPR